MQRFPLADCFIYEDLKIEKMPNFFGIFLFSQLIILYIGLSL